jgi:hypothetical protein
MQRGTVWARACLVVKGEGPVATKAGVFSFVLSWDIAEYMVGEVKMGFMWDKIETDGVEWARHPKVRFGHKKGTVKDDRSGIPGVMQFRVQPPDVGGESEIEEGDREMSVDEGSRRVRMTRVFRCTITRHL